MHWGRIYQHTDLTSFWSVESGWIQYTLTIFAAQGYNDDSIMCNYGNDFVNRSWLALSIGQRYWTLTANDLVDHPGDSGLSSSWLYWAPEKEQIHDDIIKRKHFHVDGPLLGEIHW